MSSIAVTVTAGVVGSAEVTGQDSIFQSLSSHFDSTFFMSS